MHVGMKDGMPSDGSDDGTSGAVGMPMLAPAMLILMRVHTPCPCPLHPQVCDHSRGRRGGPGALQVSSGWGLLGLGRGLTCCHREAGH